MRHLGKHLTALAAGVCVLASLAQAADPPTSAADAWRSECSSCHIAYSPRLLPAASWQELMRTLDKHFGVDASVEPDVATTIARYLETNAGRNRSASTPATRITEQSWFKREHDEAARYVGVGKKITSWSDCAACHTSADQGRFNEHDIRLPNGGRTYER